jgi:plastocyanin
MRIKVLCVAVVAVIAMVFLLPVMAERADRPAARHIVLVARDMTFYIDGASTPNPDLYVKPGEAITLTLKNADAGMTHDLAVSAWEVSTREIHGVGSARVTFTVPRTLGRTEYVCRPHSQVMRGAFIVE